MKSVELSGDQLRSAAFAAIRKELGVAGLVRFLAENLPEEGRDYTEERRAIPEESIEEIASRIAALKAQRGGSLGPKGAKLPSAVGKRVRSRTARKG